MYAEYIMWSARLESHSGIKIFRRNINNLRYADDATSMAESEEELNASWWGWKKSENAVLELNIKKTKITASNPIISWKTEGGEIGSSDRFYFLELQNHRGQWLQPWNEKALAPWKESYDKLRQHIKKQRHYFAYKGPYSQSYDFSSSHVQI